MSETDSLLPVTTTTRQRKSQRVIAARSSIGDTLVEETDGPQISKYGHSHSTFFGEEEYEEGVPRHSTWVHTAFLLLGDIVGTGVLSLAAAFAESGLPMTPLDKAGALFYVFVVGVFAWGPGTGVAIYSIAESSDDVGGPFSCQCIAKQCST